MALTYKGAALFLPDDLYEKIMQSVPILCVDAVVKNSKGQYLLVKRNFEPLKGVYWTPGGRVLKDEKLDDSIKRVLKKEIGVDAATVQPAGFFEDFFEKTRQNVPGGVHTVSVVYVVTVSSDQIQVDEQSGDWIWSDQLPERYDQYPTLMKELF